MNIFRNDYINIKEDMSYQSIGTNKERVRENVVLSEEEDHVFILLVVFLIIVSILYLANY